MNFFQRRKILKNTNFLELTPVRLMEYEAEESGKVTILVPKFKSPFLKKLLYANGPASNFKIKLDEFGSLAWLSIDGEKTTAEIATILENNFGEAIHPADQRLAKFCSSLYEQTFITFKELVK